MTLGFHLEPFATSWVHYSRSWVPKSDRDHQKVENFFQAMTIGNSSFWRQCDWYQKTDTYIRLILLLLGCGGPQSWKLVRKKVEKKYFRGHGMGCAKCSYSRGDKKSDSSWLIKMNIWACMGLKRLNKGQNRTQKERNKTVSDIFRNLCILFRVFVMVSGLYIFNCKIDSPTCFMLNGQWAIGQWDYKTRISEFKKFTKIIFWIFKISPLWLITRAARQDI